MSSSSTAYHLPSIASMAGIALAASCYVISSNNTESRKRHKRIKSKIMKEREDQYILGLDNNEKSGFANSVLQALATLPCLRSYLAELVDEQGDVAGSQIPLNEFILQSVSFALYSTIELMNRPPQRPRSIALTDMVLALERKVQCNNHEQNAFKLFQSISSMLTLEEEILYKQQVPSLLDIDTLRHFTDASEPLSASSLETFESSSFSSVATAGSMWSSFSISTTGESLNRRPRRPRNPFTGLAASKITCLKCGYTPPIRHHTFDNISLPIPSNGTSSLESCLAAYTKMDILTDYECRKCSLTATLGNLMNELQIMTSANDNDISKNTLVLKSQMEQLKKALQSNIEANLPDITLTPPNSVTRASKHIMLVNPPKSLCIHISTPIATNHIQRSHSTIQFPEYLDLSPYTTDGYLSTQNISTTLMLSSSPSSSYSDSQRCTPRTSQPNLVYFRNMSGGVFAHDHKQGLNMILPTQQPGNDNNSINGRKPSMFPSLAVPLSTIQYRLNAVIVRDKPGHTITYRRKKLIPGQETTRTSPHMMMTTDGDLGSRYSFQHTQNQQQYQRYYQTISPPPSRFWRCNDDVIDEVDISLVLSSVPYLLFYERE